MIVPEEGAKADALAKAAARAKSVASTLEHASTLPISPVSPDSSGPAPAIAATGGRGDSLDLNTR